MKYLIIFVILVFTYSCEQQPLIDDYKIEGISTGSSLMELFSSEEIEKFKLNSKKAYTGKPNQDFFYTLYFENLEVYERLSLFSRSDDEDYLIVGIFGKQSFASKDSCFEKKQKTATEFSDTYKNTIKSSGKKLMRGSISIGEFTYDYFDFPSGQRIGVQCNMYADGDITFDIAIANSIDLIEWLEYGNIKISE